MKSIAKNPLAVAISGLMLAASIGSAYADPGIGETVTVTSPKHLSAAEESAISSAAVKTLNHIAAARAALHRHDGVRAREALRQANTLLDIIEAALPTTQIRDRIQVANSKLEYQQTSEVQPDLVPIYAELGELEDFAQVKAARDHVDRANAHLKAGNKAGAREELDAVDAALYYNEADLPVSATRFYVNAAQALIAKRQFTEADHHLLAAEDNVVYLSDFVSEPLVPAKANLARAQGQLKAGNMAAAQAEVKRAIERLDQAAKRADAATRKDVEALAQDARALDRKLDAKAGTAGQDLQLLGERTAALADRAKEYVAIGWSRMRDPGELRKDLIEAKLYTRYADIDARVGHDPARVKADLASAADYLSQANTAARDHAKTREVIGDMQSTLASLQQAGTPDSTALDGLAMRMSWMIQSL